jgi:integrase
MPTRRRRTDGGVDGKVQRRGRALTYVQANKLLQECEADPMLKLVILLGVLAGLRRGEIFALLFEDIDWDANLIHVRRNLFWRYGKYHDIPVGEPRWEITTPKKNSARDVDLSPKLKDVLWTRYMEMQMEGKTGLIFQKDGEPVDPDVVYRYVFKPAVERVREEADKAEDAETMKMFSDLHKHDMRHTFGSWKLAEGERHCLCVPPAGPLRCIRYRQHLCPPSKQATTRSHCPHGPEFVRQGCGRQSCPKRELT